MDIIKKLSGYIPICAKYDSEFADDLTEAAMVIRKLTTERDELKQQLEFERIRLASCSHAALSNTDESVKDRIDNTNQYWSATYGDVCAAVDREMSLRSQLNALKAKLEGGVRVHANQYVDRDDRWLCSHYGSRKDIHNATLLLDDEVEI